MQQDALIALLKECQPLIGGLLAVFAACIFAVGSVTAARIRAGDGQWLRSGTTASEDLRMAPAPINGLPAEEPLDLVHTLEQLRSLVRSALSALTPSENSAKEPAGAAHQSYERILHLRLDKTSLPASAPQAAHELLASLVQNVDALGRLLKTKASPSDISNILIKVNTAARNLTAVLSPAPGTEIPPNPSSTLRQR